jgi:hypothetical protein
MGALVLVTPHLGVPFGWFKPLLFIFGVIIIGLGIIVRRGGKRVFRKRTRKHDYVESAPVVETAEGEVV